MLSSPTPIRTTPAGSRNLVADSDVQVAVHSSEAEIIAGHHSRPQPPQFSFPCLRGAAPPLPDLHRKPRACRLFALKMETSYLSPLKYELFTSRATRSGSIALYLPDKGIVIVGDALQHKFGWRLSPPAPGVTACPEMAMKSLEKLLSLDFHTICFSHFPPLRKDAREALRSMIIRHKLRAETSLSQAATE